MSSSVIIFFLFSIHTICPHYFYLLVTQIGFMGLRIFSYLPNGLPISLSGFPIPVPFIFLFVDVVLLDKWVSYLVKWDSHSSPISFPIHGICSLYDPFSRMGVPFQSHSDSHSNDVSPLTPIQNPFAEWVTHSHPFKM